MEETWNKHFDSLRKEVYLFLKDLVHTVVGRELSDKEFNKVYVILFHLNFRKKDPLHYVIDFDEENFNAISKELSLFLVQGQNYTKPAGIFCMEHTVLKIAKKIFLSSEKYEAVFWSQIFNLNKKKGISDINALEIRMREEIDKIKIN